MTDCWVLCRDTTSGEYSEATEPVAAFLSEREAHAALNEHAEMRAAIILVHKDYWARRVSETPQPHGYDWRERDNVGTPTHDYYEALFAWDKANGRPPEIPPEHTLAKVQLR